MYNREVKLTGHIIDSLTLPRALDLIMDMGGDFQILEFKVGKRKKDTSLARIKVSGLWWWRSVKLNWKLPPRIKLCLLIFIPPPTIPPISASRMSGYLLKTLKWTV